MFFIHCKYILNIDIYYNTYINISLLIHLLLACPVDENKKLNAQNVTITSQNMYCMPYAHFPPRSALILRSLFTVQLCHPNLE